MVCVKELAANNSVLWLLALERLCYLVCGVVTCVVLSLWCRRSASCLLATAKLLRSKIGAFGRAAARGIKHSR